MFESNETLEQARERNIRDALMEDIGERDWTAELVPATQQVKARVLVREDAVLCGRDWFEGCIAALDPKARVSWHYAEGARTQPNTPVCHVEANARALLSAERPALNFLQLLSSTATLTRQHVEAIEGASPHHNRNSNGGCAILDTRKTLPGLRQAQKYAARVGGGQNQRLALWHGILMGAAELPACDPAFRRLVLCRLGRHWASISVEDRPAHDRSHRHDHEPPRTLGVRRSTGCSTALPAPGR